jgi:hypothetical protein
MTDETQCTTDGERARIIRLMADDCLLRFEANMLAVLQKHSVEDAVCIAANVRSIVSASMQKVERRLAED